jgi:hypothetical protein
MAKKGAGLKEAKKDLKEKRNEKRLKKEAEKIIKRKNRK